MPKLKLEPLEFCRSIDYLCRLYPEKTAKEIIELSEHEKKCNELWIKNQHKSEQKLIDKINKTPLYYKGRFGLDQRFFYKFYNAELSGGQIVVSVEKIVVFLGSERGVVSVGNITIEKRIEAFKKLDTFGLSMYEETTKEEFEQVELYLRNVSAFWDDIKWE